MALRMRVASLMKFDYGPQRLGQQDHANEHEQGQWKGFQSLALSAEEFVAEPGPSTSVSRASVCLSAHSPGSAGTGPAGLAGRSRTGASFGVGGPVAPRHAPIVCCC